ncbi:hypothetical protein FLX56_26030 [Synechococcus moorigangaii CMS01]|nr:hypothetical protein [Synechococcus moorigangaii CMS01]
MSSQATNGATATSPTQNTGDCPTKPATKLDPNNVKSINLTEAATIESGIIRQGTAVGYSFEAESGQKINYETDDEICVWVYSPDNQLLTSKDLPKTGTYLIQATILQGSQTFDLEMSLDVVQARISTPTPTPTPVQPTRPSADEFIRDHYMNLNNRRYSETWERLSPNFQQKAVSYSEYRKWWNSVREIKIGNIDVINQSDDEAIVDAELTYIMKSGSTVSDPKSLIYLVWSESSNSWLFNDKTQP